MLYYSRKNHRKIIHTKNCFIVRHFDPEAIGTFETLQEALNAGYRLCRRCDPIARQYKKEREDILRYCDRNGMSCHFSGPYLKITHARTDWLVSVSLDGKLQLFHKNTRSQASDRFSPIPGYHDQGVRHGVLMGFFGYIKKHDAYRYRFTQALLPPPVKKPARKSTKKRRKEYEKIKRLERQNAIQNVLDIIDSFGMTR